MKRAAYHRIFVSYSRRDAALVNGLVKILMVADKAVFQDVKDIESGSQWRGVITMAIERCEKFILFWCAHASHSAEVEKEFRLALERGKSVVPILLDETELPKDLSELQAIDLRAALAAMGPHDAPIPESGNRTDRGGDRLRPESEPTLLPAQAATLQTAAAHLRAELTARWDQTD